MYYLKNLFVAILFILAVSSCTTPQLKNELPRSTPEAEGVSSEGILKFINAVEASNHEMHSLMFLRHGKVIAEGWWNPYNSDLKHTLYSLSKSFTSTAVGFAVSEKLITVNDKVISFFPDELPDTITPFLTELTIKDLLSMSVGQDPDPTYKIRQAGSSWEKSFFSTPIINEPGSKFLYNSLASYMLSSIVQKVTGEKAIDYLTPRLFEPLGIKGIDWEVNSNGINTGGWGLRLKTEDIARTGQLYLQKGIWNGNRIIPTEWVEEATTIKIEQAPSLSQAAKDSSDWLQGYGYQFWRCRNNAYRGDGAYGQYMIILPEQDAVIAITSETEDMQGELNLVWEYLLPAISGEKLPVNEKGAAALMEKLSALSLPLPEKTDISPIIKSISDKPFIVEPNYRKINKISFHFSDNLCEVTIDIENNNYIFSFAADGWHMGETLLPGPNLIPNPFTKELLPAKVAGNFYWKDENTLELKLRYIESPHSEKITCSFIGKEISISVTDIFNRNRNNPEIKGKSEE